MTRVGVGTTFYLVDEVENIKHTINIVKKEKVESWCCISCQLCSWVNYLTFVNLCCSFCHMGMIHVLQDCFGD
jgi:hypothetical protein